VPVPLEDERGHLPVKVKRVGASLHWAIGVDASLTGFGVAAWRPDTPSVTARFTSKKKGVERLDDIDQWFRKWLAMYPPAMICMEGYSFGSKFSHSHSIGELGGVIKLGLLHSVEQPVCFPTIVSPNELKKYVVGKGNAKKEELMLAVFRKWGFEAPNNDEADAYGLARMAACMVGLDQPSHAYERDTLAGLTPWTEAPQPK
jgi:crossover junction endodeoxyribonuclease RuvC